MPKQPLFPHIPGKREPLFPHMPKGRLLPSTKRYEFFPEEVRKLLPPSGSIGEERDPMVWVKFFTPWSYWTWYAIEFDGKDIFFGWVVGLEKEFGSFSLSELQSLRGPGGLKIERDIYFEPKPISQVMKEPLATRQIEFLASTEGDPKGSPRKFCCRQCGECAPTELLEGGRFPDRIAWLRHHYKEKHPSMWGKIGKSSELIVPLIHKEDKTWYLGEWWEQEHSTADAIVYRSADGKKRLYIYWDGRKEVKPGDESQPPSAKADGLSLPH